MSDYCACLITHEKCTLNIVQHYPKLTDTGVTYSVLLVGGSDSALEIFQPSKRTKSDTFLTVLRETLSKMLTLRL